MQLTDLLRPRRNEHGIALPTALIALALLTTLMVAFAVLSKSEPLIARNHWKGSQARALAEAGVERALWALTSTVIPNPMAGSIAPSPYDGSTFLALGTAGGFFVTVSNGTATNERVVEAVGWTPTYSTTVPGAAHRRVHLTVSQVKFLGAPPPAALSARGNLSASGHASVVASDNSCGVMAGAETTGNQTVSGDVNFCCTPGQLENVPTSIFDQYMLTDSDLNALKALAKASGTYMQGNQVFNAGNPIPANGLVFIDTPSGNNLSCTPTPPTTCTNPDSDMITVSIAGNAGPGGSSTFSGWIVVNGSVTHSGNTTINGLLYAQNDITMSGTPTVNGAVMSRNIKDLSSTNIDASVEGNISINYDCAKVKAISNFVPTGWSVKAGTYREISD